MFKRLLKFFSRRVSHKDVPVGRRLFDEIGEDDNRRYSVREQMYVATLIDEVCVLIERYRNDNKINRSINEKCLIDCLYPSFEKLDERKKTQLMTQCMLECLQWCKEVILKQKVVPHLMLRNCVLDIAYCRILGEQFGMCGSRRSHFWIPEDSYVNACRWYYYGVPPGRLTSEFMSIFELRQTMETRFRKLLGIKSISNGIKVKHEVIPEILESSITTKNFSPASGITLTQIRHVYDWTDLSIHMMCTDYVWIVWKAFQTCGAMFTGVQRNNGMMSIHDSFEFSEDLLETMRKKFVDRIKAANPRIQEFSISWDKPEAAIVDQNGNWMEVKPRMETISGGEE